MQLIAKLTDRKTLQNYLCFYCYSYVCLC